MLEDGATFFACKDLIVLAVAMTDPRPHLFERASDRIGFISCEEAAASANGCFGWSVGERAASGSWWQQSRQTALSASQAMQRPAIVLVRQFLGLALLRPDQMNIQSAA